jgi:tetrahydromethanopterin S-methyltransferase subunit A
MWQALKAGVIDDYQLPVSEVKLKMAEVRNSRQPTLFKPSQLLDTKAKDATGDSVEDDHDSDEGSVQSEIVSLNIPAEGEGQEEETGQGDAQAVRRSQRVIAASSGMCSICASYVLFVLKSNSISSCLSSRSGESNGECLCR